MIALSQPYSMTTEEYLEWEEKQPLKYEYVNGEVYAMTGGTIPHNDITFNFASALRNHLKGRGCKVQISDAKVQILDKNIFHYPDVVVSCDKRDQQAIQFLQYPCLIIEVLSPSTAGFDRGRKFKNYRSLETLKEYVLVDTEQLLIDCFRLNEQGIWELYTFDQNEELQLKSVDFACSMELIYEGVTLPEDSSNQNSNR